MAMGEMETATARVIMRDFARLTGLDPAGTRPKRYLWTDAFAVCNYLELHRLTGEDLFRDLALRLVDQVHHTLGQYRDDDRMRGWISGLGEAEGEEHPTIGGLRIGKGLPERRPDEPPDERLEWDRDGQYYHYLTRWMHSLLKANHATGDPRYLRWALELAGTAHARFTYTSWQGGGKRMYWKMSTDLSRPLVTSMGQHDPPDGLVTYSELELARSRAPASATLPSVEVEIAELAGICRAVDLATDDPLGTGGLLSDSLLIARILVEAGDGFPGERAGLRDLLGEILSAALFGLDAFADSGCTGLPPDYRLAFRELGLAIGLSGVGELTRLIDEHPARFGEDSLRVQAEALQPYLPLRETITGFWREARNQEAASWKEHREINMVMLATSLVPAGYLGDGGVTSPEAP
ncbi:MAG: hypothetical protein LUO96_03155 [Methanomicrobiales archaeon]|nr:hypothetical protein [Methanomicrobiales archaeon]